MTKVFESTGGRKVFIGLVVALILVVTDAVGIELSDVTMARLTELAQWVVIAIAVEDGATKLLGKKK